MRYSIISKILIIFIAIISVSIFPLSCGSGGSGGRSHTERPGSTSGSVALLIADGPADEYDSILLYITEASLIPADGGSPVVIFRSRTPQGLELDLLDYRNEDYLLAVRDGVPAGEYSKIRLQVRDIVPIGGTGPCTEFDVKLPSGKIDLNPGGPFTVTEGGHISVRLDMDANKSINLHQAGNSGKCIFRPVVFVDIEEGAQVRRCPAMLAGTIDGFIEEQGERVGFYLAPAEDRGVLKVLFTEDAAIFDQDGKPMFPADLVNGQEVRIRGRLDLQHRFLASVVISGDVLILKGIAAGRVETGMFPFIPFGSANTVDVRISDKTLILFGCNTRLYDPGMIQAGMTVTVAGKYMDGTFNAVLIVLREISGEVMEFQPAAGMLILQAGNGAIQEISVPAGAPVYLTGDGRAEQELICTGRQARVLIDPAYYDSYGILRAQEIEIQPDQTEGTVVGTDAAGRVLTLETAAGTTMTVQVRQGATILDLTGNSGAMIVPFYSLLPGDRLSIIGLYPCPTDGTTGFYGFVVMMTGR